MTSKKSNICFLLLLTTAFSVVAFSCKNSTDKNSKWITAPVTRQDLSNLITCTGSLEPITEVEVGTQVSGRVEKIYVDYNSVVTKGQLLAEIDQTVFAASL